LAESLFESVDVLGLDTMHVEPTPAAVRRCLAEAFRADELVMVGARGLRADTTVTNPADPGHERAEPRLPGLGDRVDKPQRGLHVTGFGEGDSRGFVSRSGENRVRTCVEHGAETRGYMSPSRAPWFRAEGAVRHWGRPRAPCRLDR
jgi:hypothetical protein